jgi:rhodanese-related sulfurtransferase
VTPRQFLAAARVTIPRVTPDTVANRVRAGEALLIDVREPKEWATGHAEGAFLLPLSQLSRSRVDWDAVRHSVGDRGVILYCGAGVRSNLAARAFHAHGFHAVNGGALREWAAAGWPTITGADAERWLIRRER